MSEEIIKQDDNYSGSSLPTANVATHMQPAVMRQVAEVQASMVIAKQFPRDVNAAFKRIMDACHRRNLAEQAIYSYPRGGTKVEGPSIRLAEAIAQAWGNIDFGIHEVEQKDGESVVEAVAWDKETNTRQVKRFTVKHERHTRKGVTKLNDPRDVYELVANQGARRLRACILGIIPGDIIESAVNECNKTLLGQSDVPLGDRIRSMVVAFGEMGVSQEEIEEFLGHKVDACSPQQVARLGKVYKAMQDGYGKKEDYFKPVSSMEKKPDTKKSSGDDGDAKAKAEAEKAEKEKAKAEKEAKKKAKKEKEAAEKKAKEEAEAKEKAKKEAADKKAEKEEPESKEDEEEPEAEESGDDDADPLTEFNRKIEEEGHEPELVEAALVAMKKLKDGEKIADLPTKEMENILAKWDKFAEALKVFKEKHSK